MAAYKTTECERVTAEIKNQVSEWFGHDARLAPGIPELRTLKNSFFVRYGIVLNGGKEGPRLLIKIPRSPSTKTLKDALDSQRSRPAIRREYEFLVACSKIFEDKDLKELCAVRPVGYLALWNAIAMEELKCRPLRVVDWRHHNLKFVDRLTRAAQWLSVFHERMGEPATEPVSTDFLRSQFTTYLSALQSSSRAPIKELPRIYELLDPRLLKIDNAQLLFAGLHGDFKYSNIVVSEDGRVGAIDCKLLGRGPIYMDLGKLIATVLSDSLNLLSFGVLATFQECKDSILRGYFKDRTPDENALHLYSALILLEKWKEKEQALNRLGHASPMFRFLVRKHFGRLMVQTLRI